MLSGEEVFLEASNARTAIRIFSPNALYPIMQKRNGYIKRENCDEDVPS
jgi:hypothetical protein